MKMTKLSKLKKELDKVKIQAKKDRQLLLAIYRAVAALLKDEIRELREMKELKHLDAQLRKRLGIKTKKKAKKRKKTISTSKAGKKSTNITKILNFNEKHPELERRVIKAILKELMKTK